jgi:hypothetical protein
MPTTRSSILPRRLKLALALVLAATMASGAGAASAQALTVSATAAPASTTAGANSDVNVQMSFSGGQVRDLRVELPPGLVGNPNATPRCTVTQLQASACPANTQVGEVEAVANILSLPAPVNVSGELYNLDPQPGEPARFGIVLSPPVGSDIILQSAVQLRSDYGLDTVITNIPNTTLVSGDTTIVSQDITLYGSRPWMSGPFMRNPTSCGSKTVTVDADPYSGAAASDEASFAIDSCASLDFSPEFSATVGGQGMTAQNTLTSVTTAIDQAATEAGLRRAVVLTPADFGANVAQLDGVCSPGDFQAGSCPATSVVGNAVATSPLLSAPLTGPVVLVDTDELPLIGLDLSGQLSFKLLGTLAFDNKVTFDNLPDIPIAHFELQFAGGPEGLLFANRDLCAPPAPVFTGTFSSHGGVDVPFSRDAAVQGCGPVYNPVPPGAKKCKKAKKRKKAGKSEATAAAKKKRCGKKKRKKG